MIEKNKMAPSFCLESQNHTWMNLEQLRGKKVFLFFLPKSNCLSDQVQLMSYVSEYRRFLKLNVEVIGICGSPMEDIQEIAFYFKLPFLLLEDRNHLAREAYGVWREKVTYGIRRSITSRSTLVIDESGIVIKTYKRIKAESNVQEVLEFLEQLAEKNAWRQLSRREKEKIRKEKTHDQQEKRS